MRCSLRQAVGIAHENILLFIFHISIIYIRLVRKESFALFFSGIIVWMQPNGKNEKYLLLFLNDMSHSVRVHFLQSNDKQYVATTKNYSQVHIHGWNEWLQLRLLMPKIGRMLSQNNGWVRGQSAVKANMCIKTCNWDVWFNNYNDIICEKNQLSWLLTICSRTVLWNICSRISVTSSSSSILGDIGFAAHNNRKFIYFLFTVCLVLCPVKLFENIHTMTHIFISISYQFISLFSPSLPQKH